MNPKKLNEDHRIQKRRMEKDENHKSSRKPLLILFLSLKTCFLIKEKE